MRREGDVVDRTVSGQDPFAQSLREEVRGNAQSIATENGLEIEHIRKLKAFRKERRIQEVLNHRGNHPGLVHIFSAMETCH